MHVSFLGGAREVGRSAILLETDKRILLDCGIKLYGETSYPAPVAKQQYGGARYQTPVAKKPQGDTSYPVPFAEKPHLAVITHAHLDHSGFIPAVFERYGTKFLGTPPTQALSSLLIEDSMRLMKKVPYAESSYNGAMNHFKTISYEKEYRIGNSRLILHDAGHIPGSSMVQIEHDGRRIVYTGDFKMEGTRMHNPTKPIEDTDVLITESTYFDKEHPDREKLEREISEEIKETIDEGGNVLFPAFAVGRTQELIMAIRRWNRNVPIYTEGMSNEATSIMLRFPEYIRDFHLFEEATSSVTKVTSRGKRKSVLSHPSVIIASAGMLQGGSAIRYLTNLNNKSKVIFVGYCVEGTNGRRLIDEGIVNIDGYETRIRTPVMYMDLSAHAGRSDLFAFIKKCNPAKIFCVHGDNCDRFAFELKEMGFDAIAPGINDMFIV
jgi:putative mRNA 3-end processing factor